MSEDRPGTTAWSIWESERKRKSRKQNYSDKSRIVPLSKAITQWKKSSKTKETENQAIIISSWEEILGSKIAENSQPLELRSGTLLVKVRESAWRYNLQFMRDEMKREINKALGSKIVKEIKLVG